MVRKYMLLASLGHTHKPTLVHEKCEQLVGERGPVSVVVEAMHAVLEIKTATVPRPADHWNGAGEAGLIVTIAIPPMALR
jgi:hypothetical protein